METLRAAVDALARLDVARLDNDDLGELIVEASLQRDRLEAVLNRAVARQDERAAWKSDGARSQKQWLADRCRMSMGQAASTARTARGLAQLPETTAALADGRLGSGHARVAANAVRDLPSETRAGLDRLIAEEGTDTDPSALRKKADDYAHRAAPDSLAAREQRAWRNRRLSSARRADGGVSFEGQLDTVGAEAVLTALAPLAAPKGPADDRTAEQRRADALVELARRHLDSGRLPDSGGVRPHVTVTVSLETLLDKAGASAAAVDLVGAVSGETARLLACDAGVTRVITAGASQPLDVGRQTRVVTVAQRRALAARDGGCVGCGAPAGWCEGHHIRHWVDGGPTDIANLVLLCHGCHRAVHHSGWKVRQRADGTYTVQRPTRPHARAARRSDRAGRPSDRAQQASAQDTREALGTGGPLRGEAGSPGRAPARPGHRTPSPRATPKTPPSRATTEGAARERWPSEGRRPGTPSASPTSGRGSAARP